MWILIGRIQNVQSWLTENYLKIYDCLTSWGCNSLIINKDFIFLEEI